MWLARQIITLVVNIRVFLIRQLLPSSYLLAPAPGRYREKENALSFFNALNIETSPELVEYITMIKTGEPMKDPLDFVRRVERSFFLCSNIRRMVIYMAMLHMAYMFTNSDEAREAHLTQMSNILDQAYTTQKGFVASTPNTTTQEEHYNGKYH